MIKEILMHYERIQEKIQTLPLNELLLSPDEETQLRSKKIDQLIESETALLDFKTGNRIKDEFYKWGPLCQLMEDEEITEILVNGPTNIWFEKRGCLQQHQDSFLSELSYRNCIERLSQAAKCYITVEHPSADSSFGDFRLSLIGADLTQSHPHLSLRRHPRNPWTFEKLQAQSWCSEADLLFFRQLIAHRKNFLVVGSTGSGKTSVLNSLLNLLPENERVVVIEDTSEIALSNSASMKLLTREDPQGILPSIDQTLLVKRSLRLRPDRLVMGEVRGAEAKDFLMALATGHAGSFGTLHAQDAAQALIRLEMLIQMGAPQWNLTAIRRLIQLSLDYILVVGREPSGLRVFKGAYRLCSLEDHGFLVELTNSIESEKILEHS
ncbi:ATPase, T2SS/T4P/T4SS family [Bdellovibrio sp. SKB1291214]|uniref:CpaF family protein n=1 Tax=Bdellovibrio sp. SKB1291214 TaxID=1732569 RepID=UPI000B51CEDA|nr:ATPase, T2SS/T4P/T4SS family [Bdellovibrio sp. SKB1291214]UYL09176.1 ATPase, T2SS/T4P/T4SS family [Bdellovibrio sp. SKB1291214]